MSRNIGPRISVATLALGLAGVLALSGCSGDPEPGKSSSPPKTSTSSSPSTPPTVEIDPNAPDSSLPPELRPDPNNPDSPGVVSPQPIPNPTPMTDAGTVDCGFQDFDLTVSNVTVTLEGECGGVVVSGDNVVLNAASTMQTKITGNNVTFNGAKVGWVVIEGNNAKVDLTDGFIYGVQITGSNNTVVYANTSTDRQIDNGTGNKISKK